MKPFSDIRRDPLLLSSFGFRPAPSVLIVDDDSELSSLLSLVLEREGFDVLAAQEPEHALRRVRREKPDLAVIDVESEGAGGLDLLRAIRSESELPVILLGRPVGCDFRADEYLMKPFSHRELAWRLRSMLHRRQN